MDIQNCILISLHEKGLLIKFELVGELLFIQYPKGEHYFDYAWLEEFINQEMDIEFEMCSKQYKEKYYTFVTLTSITHSL